MITSQTPSVSAYIVIWKFGTKLDLAGRWTWRAWQQILAVSPTRHTAPPAVVTQQRSVTHQKIIFHSNVVFLSPVCACSVCAVPWRCPAVRVCWPSVEPVAVQSVYARLESVPEYRPSNTLAMTDEYLLAWNDHHSTFFTAMSELVSGQEEQL